MDRAVVRLLVDDQVQPVLGVAALELRDGASPVLRIVSELGQQPGSVEEEIRVNRGLGLGGHQPSSKWSAIASLIGRSVASSIHRYWPLGLISRKTKRSSGVRMRSMAP